MKDFNNVDRYYMYPGDGPGVYPEIEEDGPYVLYEDYKDLLEEYNELKYRLDSLEK